MLLVARPAVSLLVTVNFDLPACEASDHEEDEEDCDVGRPLEILQLGREEVSIAAGLALGWCIGDLLNAHLSVKAYQVVAHFLRAVRPILVDLLQHAY